MVLTESFENAPCSGKCWGSYQPNGQIDQLSATPSNTFPSKAGYVGQTGTQWSIMGYCLEVNSVGENLPTVADGTHSAELDCDNGSHSAGNSSISNLSYYAAGTYELRYSYSGRVNYPNYNPMYICGTTAADVAWANDTTTSATSGTTAPGNELRNNQINVYFDPNTNGAAPTHTTMDATQTLAGSDLIDMCVYSANWIQRSVKITISTAGYYWLSFAADGANDSYGGELDNIMVCRTACSGSVTDNFPSAWSNALLFEDTFKSPTYSGGGSNFNGNGLLGSSYGTTSTGTGGWPGQSAVGWSVAPYNEVGYLTKYSDQGTQSIQLDNYDPFSGQTTTNRTISRPFYLDPGYYKITYDYVGDAVFPSVPGQYCVYAPTGSLSAYAYTGMLSYQNKLSGATGSVGNDTDSLAVFMAHSGLASSANVGTTVNAATTYTNPDGSVTTTPTVAPDALNLSTYNASQVNPVLDYCGYSGSWMTRTTYVKITKPGQYWLIFAAKGSADTIGAAIDDVKLTALNSLYGSASSFYVAIPTPSAVPGSTISYTGFSIIADPLTP